ncbi:MAG: tetratricopeptide repeat protein [Oligoflexus sp.]
MINMEEFAKKWAHYPMGPNIRRYLGISDEEYQGEHAARPDDEIAAQFADELRQVLSQHIIQDFHEWVDVLEELTAMGLASTVCFLTEEDYRQQADHDFRALLAIGSAYMLESEDELALRYLQKAHELEAGELAPYVNIASIHYAFERDQDARLWAESGLQVDANHHRLWEILASVHLHENPHAAGEQLKTFAERINSYLGLSLAADLIDPDDALLKAQYLESVFQSDKIDADFLIEYTAALGMAKQFEKIPSVIWKAERISGISIPWKVYAHGAQAYLSQEDPQGASSLIDSLKAIDDAPKDLIAELEQARQEMLSAQH